MTSQRLNSNLRILGVLALCIVFWVGGITLRLYKLDNKPLTGDEIVSLAVSTGAPNLAPRGLKARNFDEPRFLTAANNKIKQQTVSEALRRTAVENDGNMAFYHGLLHMYATRVTVSTYNMRILSVILDCFGVIAFCLILRHARIHNAKIAGVLLLWAIHPVSIWMSQTTRAYSLAPALGALLVFAVYGWERGATKVLQKRWAWVAALALIFALLGFCHYLSMYLAASPLLYLVLSKRWGRMLSGYLIAATLSILLVGAWIIGGSPEGGLHHSSQLNQEYAAVASQGASALARPTSIVTLAGGTTQLLLADFGNGMQQRYRLRFLLPLLIIPICCLIRPIYLAPTEESFRLDVLAASVIICQITQATVLAVLTGHIISFQVLYGHFGSIFAVFLLSNLIFELYKWNRRLAVTVLTVQVLISTVSVMFYFDL